MLKDIIEDEVDSKYYLSDTILKYIERSKERNKLLKRGFGANVVEDLNTKSTCITAGYSKYQNSCETYIKQPMCNHVANIDIKGYTGKAVRRLTPLECERLQTLPDNYTNHHVSDSQRYKMIGNGFTAKAIAHILKNIKQ
jgi:site-specific DNA-cytosine methylase